MVAEMKKTCKTCKGNHDRRWTSEMINAHLRVSNTHEARTVLGWRKRQGRA